MPCLVLPLSGVLSSIPGQKPCRPPTNPACQVSQQRELNQRQQSQFSIQCHSAASANPFRAPSWHFRGVASSLLGPHQTGARATTLNLTPQPHDQPHEPHDPSRDDPPAGDFEVVASSIQGPHPRQLVFPPHPCPATAAAARVYLKPSRAS